MMISGKQVLHAPLAQAAALLAAALMLAHAWLAPGRLRAAETSCSRGGSSLIGSFLEETNAEKKQELIRKMRALPAEEVAACWLDRLEDARSGEKIRIIEEMADYPEKRFVLPLANYLVDNHQALRRAAARSLKKIGDDRLYPVILNMVNSDVAVHRIYFIEAMNYLYDSRFYPLLAGLMRDENKSIRIYVLNCLKENRIAESLGIIRGSALSDKNDEVRIVAIEAIGALRDGNGLSVLHITLNDKNRDVRCESARSIRLINSLASVNPLSYRLMAEEDDEIKDIMLETLSVMRRIGDVRGLEKILATDSSLSLRIKSAYVLSFSGSLQGQAALQQGLRDRDYRVRAEVCNSLGYYKNRQSLASLFEVLSRESNFYIKTAALNSVRRINDKSSLMGLFDLYTVEREQLFKELLRDAVKEFIKRFI
jgi:HEAT repeat protein